MNVNKVSKAESSSANKDSIGGCLGSFVTSRASSSKKDRSPKENEMKTSLAHSSINHVNDISDGSKVIKSNFTCKQALCATKSSVSNEARLLKKNEVKTSAVKSSNTTRTWNTSCRQLVCAFGDSKSKPSNKSPPSLFKKNELRSHSGQSDRSQQTNPAKLSTLPPIPVMKRQIQKTSYPKDPPKYNLQNKLQKNQTQKDPPPLKLHKKTQKCEVPRDFTVATLKRETSKAETKKTRSEIPAASVKKIGTRKASTPSMASHDMTNQPSSSQYRPYSSTPIYHIKWDGSGKKHKPSGQKCVLCNKDFSVSPQGDDYGSDRDDEDNDVYKYHIEFRPQLVPSVDIFPCGHAFHSECSRYVIPEEQSADPQCFVCLSMT